MTIESYSREERKLRKALASLIIKFRLFESRMDVLYAKSMDRIQRGEKVAELMNALTMAHDQALYFDLGYDFRNDKKGHKHNLTRIAKWASKTTKESL